MDKTTGRHKKGKNQEKLWTLAAEAKTEWTNDEVDALMKVVNDENTNVEKKGKVVTIINSRT